MLSEVSDLLEVVVEISEVGEDTTELEIVLVLLATLGVLAGIVELVERLISGAVLVDEAD